MNHIRAIQDGFTEFEGTGAYYKLDSPHCSVEEEQTVPEDYECKRCGNGIENDEWIEETLENENAILNKL